MIGRIGGKPMTMGRHMRSSTSISNPVEVSIQLERGRGGGNKRKGRGRNARLLWQP